MPKTRAATSPSRPPKRISTSRRIIYATLTALLILEMGARAILFIDRPSNGDGVMPSDDPGLMFVPYVGQAAGPETGPVNQLGTRGPDPDLSKPNRILVIGDSVAYGLGVPDESSFPRQLEQLLGPQETTVINGAVPGYETWQETRRLETLAPTVTPTTIVIQFFGNDKWRTPDEVRDWARRQRAPRHIVYGDRAQTALVRASALMQLTALHSKPRQTVATTTHRSEHWARAWEDMLRLSKQHAEETLVLLMPARTAVLESRGETDLEATRIAERLGVPVVDLIGPLREHGAGALYIEGDSVHLNPRGHSVVARLVRDQLTGGSSASF